MNIQIGDLVRVKGLLHTPGNKVEDDVGQIVGTYWNDYSDEVLVRVLLPSGIRLASYENLEVIQRATQ